MGDGKRGLGTWQKKGGLKGVVAWGQRAGVRERMTQEMPRRAGKQRQGSGEQRCARKGGKSGG